MKLLILSFFTLSVFGQNNHNSTQETLPPLVVTSKGGFPDFLGKSAWSISKINSNRAVTSTRSMAEALSSIPSIMVQKTSLGQSSPYIRGLTGYHNLLLVDGIRLNHSAMRSGPNQYWSTVEAFGTNQIELVRGSNGIIHGADAIGGVVNIVSKEPVFSDYKVLKSGNFLGRLSSAEGSWMAALKGSVSSSKWFGEISHAERSFGDLKAGKEIGKQSNTGYDSRGTNFRVARKLSQDAKAIFGVQQTFMNDVPRTHKTTDGLTWMGLSPGSERWRRLDQQRNLYYGKLKWQDLGGAFDSGIITLSLHQHEQERNRMKERTSGGDFQFFDLKDIGINARFETDDLWGGILSYGVEWHRESLLSGGYKFDDNEIKLSDLVQGPLAADAHYNRLAFYLNDSVKFESGWTLEPGIRFATIRAELDRYYLKNNDVSTVQNSETKNYDELIGSIRASKNFGADKFFFVGLSQGFRPPSLYDLTSTDETSAIEKPNTKLEPEKFLQAEIGTRISAGDWSFFSSYYYTWINDMIMRSPIETGKSNVLKANGDGYIQGVEIELSYDWTQSWKSDIRLSWMDGKIEQLLDNNATGTVSIDGRNYSPTDRSITRLMPPQIYFSTRFTPQNSNWWAEFSALAVSKADKLSLKDETDGSRIPKDGTPSYLTFGIRGSRKLTKNSSLYIGIENLSDEDYRVHGSGLNGSGRNFIVSLSNRF